MENIENSNNSNNSATENKINRLITGTYDFSISDCFQKAFDTFKKNMGNFIIFTLLFGFITAILSSIPYVGWIASLFIVPQLMAGFFLVGKKVADNETTTFNDFFEGFQFVIPLCLLYLVMGILISIGFFLLIIPGLYLLVSYSLALPLVIFEKMDFWPAMEASRKIVTKQWFLFLGLLVLLALLNFAGALLFFVGLLFTIPITYLVLLFVYDRVVGITKTQV